MRLGSFSGMCLVALLGSQLGLQACGSDDTKKKTPPHVDFDGGGQGGESTNAMGGTGTSDAGAPPVNGDAGTGPDQGGQAGSGAEPVGGASDGGAAGGGNVTPFHGLYVGEAGLDTNGGSIDEPFATLAHAASIVQPGDTIVFLDGEFDQTTSVVIPDGVNLMAQNAGQATLKGGGASSSLLNLSGDTRIDGLQFEAYARVVYWSAGADATGSVTISNSLFTGCSTTCLQLIGSVSASVIHEGDVVVGNGGRAFAILDDSASLEMTGGVLQNYDAGGVIRANDDSTISLTDVQVMGGTGDVLLMNQNAVGALDGVTFQTAGQILVDQKGQSELTVKNADLSFSNDTAYYAFALNMNGVGSLLVEDTKIHHADVAFRGSIPDTLTITRTDVSDMRTSGIELGNGFQGIGGSVHITDSTFLDCRWTVMRMGSSSNLNAFVFRGTEVAAPASVVTNAIVLDGGNASTVDLGTLADPGGNTFTNANVNQSALWLGFQAVSVKAVGNTWTPSVQNADDQGHYAATGGAGAKLTVAGGVTGGRNFAQPYGGSLLLAENP